MAKMSKWKDFMLDVGKFISPYQNSTNPTKDIGNAMCDAGFSDFVVEVRDKIFVFEGVENLKSFYLKF